MQKGRIIVVDDEENIRNTLQKILTDEGYKVSCASDGENALKIVKSEAPDLVLLDVWIPGIDGMQTLKILKDIDPETEIVMMSGHSAIDTAVKATKIGAFDFIEKPFSLDAILLTVAKALKNRRARLAKTKQPMSSDSGLVDRRFKGLSKEADEIRRVIQSTAKSDKPTLILGEAGLGKKFIARLIHNMSSRRDKPFIEISCAGLREETFENALLGVDNDAPSGTLSKLELATGGTIFFDNVNRLPFELQKRIIEVIKKGKYDLSGDRGTVTFDTRFMASFAIKPKMEREDKKAIDDLKILLDGTAIELPPLRDRKEDIAEFVEQFVDQFCDEYGRHIESVSEDALKILVGAPWPGNVSQLKDMLGQAVMACDGPILKKEHLRLVNLDRKLKGGLANAEDTANLTPEGLRVVESRRANRDRLPREEGVRQKTLKNSVVLCGQGLHSGIKTGLILSPLPPGSGIIFEDINTGRRVPAVLENVINAEYATTLSDGQVTIKTVEHIMSALHSYGVTNLLIKIGDEAPIMDGSALDFCQLIENSGIEEQNAIIEEIVLDQKLSIGDPDNGAYLSVEPSDKFSIHYFLDYPLPIGKQEHVYEFESSEHYKRNIAPARTFGFLNEIKKLEEAGLASGGKLSNVVLIDGEKVINTPLRFPNEPARHKVLDIIGDLYLLGRPIKGHFIARKSGHTQNIAMVQKIIEHISGFKKIESKHSALSQ